MRHSHRGWGVTSTYGGVDRVNILYVCRAVDDEARWTAAQVQWIRTLARHPSVGRVHVLATMAGEVSFPDNVTIAEFRRGSGSGPMRRLKMLLAFWSEVLRAPLRPDCYFVVQGGPYPAQLLPFKLLTGRPIYQWKAQQHVSPRMRFYARYCDDLVFTATEQSLPLTLPNKRVVGHGIDTDLFRPHPVEKDGDFITVGRISPIKRIDRMIEAIAICRDALGTTPRLDIVGHTGGSTEPYADQLRDMVKRFNLEESVCFLGHVNYRDLPPLLSRYRASLNFSGTAFDKAVGEAMACGVPVLSTNPCVIESLPANLHPHLVPAGKDTDGLARAMLTAMAWDESSREWLEERVREYIVEEHSLRSLFSRILGEVEAHQGLATNGSEAA
jgi:glycosyltransferase involved in cell wall biosynthesis